MCYPQLDPFGDAEGAFIRRLRQHDRELLAAVARGEVGGAIDGPRDDVADAAQALVPDDVAIAVVEELEMVDVEEDQRQGRPRAAEPTVFDLEDAIELS